MLGASSIVDRVVVLPSSYDVSVPVVREALSRPNVYAFAREAASYRQVKSLGSVTLALDPALYAFDFSASDRAVTDEPIRRLVTDRTADRQGQPARRAGLAPSRRYERRHKPDHK